MQGAECRVQSVGCRVQGAGWVAGCPGTAPRNHGSARTSNRCWVTSSRAADRLLGAARAKGGLSGVRTDQGFQLAAESDVRAVGGDVLGRRHGDGEGVVSNSPAWPARREPCECESRHTEERPSQGLQKMHHRTGSVPLCTRWLCTTLHQQRPPRGHQQRPPAEATSALYRALPPTQPLQACHLRCGQGRRAQGRIEGGLQALGERGRPPSPCTPRGAAGGDLVRGEAAARWP